MFPGRYSEIFGLGERLGCILNLGAHLFYFACHMYLRIGRRRRGTSESHPRSHPVLPSPQREDYYRNRLCCAGFLEVYKRLPA